MSNMVKFSDILSDEKIDCHFLLVVNFDSRGTSIALLHPWRTVNGRIWRLPILIFGSPLHNCVGV